MHTLRLCRSASTLKGVSLNIKYTRMNQVYAVPIHLSPVITSESVITAAVVPVCFV